MADHQTFSLKNVLFNLMQLELMAVTSARLSKSIIPFLFSVLGLGSVSTDPKTLGLS